MRWLVLILAVAAPGKADLVELGATQPGSFESTVGSYQTLAQEFSVAHQFDSDALWLFMSGYGSDEFTIFLTNNLGPASNESNVLLEATATFPNTGGAINGSQITGDWITTPLGFDLEAGNYFIVLSSSQTQTQQGWVGALPSSIIATPLGTVGAALFASPQGINAAFPPGSSFKDLDVTTYQNGVPYFGTPFLFEFTSSVPEPTSIILLGTVVIGIGIATRRSTFVRLVKS